MLRIRRSLLGFVNLHPLLSTAACLGRISVQHSTPVRHIHHQIHLPSITAAAGSFDTRSVAASQLLSVQVSPREHAAQPAPVRPPTLFPPPPAPVPQDYEKQRRAFGELRRPLLKQVCFPRCFPVLVMAHSHPFVEQRRVAVGPHMSALFMNYDLVWFQIHEMLRIEGGGDEQVRDELQVPGAWDATLQYLQLNHLFSGLQSSGTPKERSDHGALN
jgi:hypothetical protein